jgi:hypothetical protein
MKRTAFILLFVLSAPIFGQVFQNGYHLQRLVVGQPNTLLLGAGISNIKKIDISRLSQYGDGNPFFSIELDDSKSQLIVTPMADAFVLDTVYHDWVDWEKSINEGNMICEIRGDTMFLDKENLETGLPERVWSVRDRAHPIKSITKRSVDLVERSSFLPFRLVVTTELGTYEQEFECVQVKQEPFVTFCGINGGELDKKEVSANSGVWINFCLSETDRARFPKLQPRNAARSQRFDLVVAFESGRKRFSVDGRFNENGMELSSEILEAIHSEDAKKLFIDYVAYPDNNDYGESAIWSSIEFTLK